jgi:Skp family chaperone for outer membrane proteins
VQWETTNKLQLELDKQRRENADLRRELAQKEALLDGMKKDMQNKISKVLKTYLLGTLTYVFFQ